jgi:NAD(P)-dependent dehydrogenase (short-subunit alcohol dehydrogenase family)
MDMGLRERVVLVTGSSSGIGRATAIAFGREGARVGVTYRNNREQAEDTARHVIDAGGQALVLPYDLASEESIQMVMNTLLEQWGSIHVLVNNAVQWGNVEDLVHTPLFEEVPASSWKHTLDLGLAGVYQTIQCAVPAMRRQQWGRIVTLSSSVVEDAFPGVAPYATAKAGLHGLHRVLASELGSVGILANVVLPGFTLTEKNQRLIPQTMRDGVARQTPTGRLTTPEDVAALIVFLSSAANGHVNGEFVRVNGGI